MKKYNITVNGKTYEVEVEEVGGAPSAAPAPKAAPAAAPAPKAAPAPAPKVSGSMGAQKVVAPMPGTIVSVKVNVGDKVEKGTLVAVLEAMKMENEIFAGVDGVVASVNVSAGDSVNAQDVIVSVN
ncbi:MAG TPA: acetyl-CoA carboxylase biotin carboxyl carrier protein subunit [Candidatus Ornithomonoglobus merdipullorum]|uniref:Acetyl-CoA carboxylase biotin carboxyl carrier protein subunit n=1 Tax=Candidatus Ornithomonoglobus merdipullorum TaxID=2840895 RepID=A0A9D1SFC1_9FIRM|nr:acetyl-CoA carboxylase biotin carboxyl carrier protein subunit [Candidatus Ornithomonoglobus merdipullorum]